MQKRVEFNIRSCTRCGEKVIDVRDVYTFATYPVNAQSVSQEGLVLTPHKDTRKNPFAHHAVVYEPHLPVCKVQDHEGEDSVDQAEPEKRDPTEPILVDGDPASLHHGSMAGEEEEEF